MDSMGNSEKPKKFVQTVQIFQPCEFDLNFFCYTSLLSLINIFLP